MACYSPERDLYVVGTFDQFDEAYDTFANAADEHALKVIIAAGD